MPDSIIGDNVSIGDNTILGKRPKLAKSSTEKFVNQYNPLRIGDNVIIGCDVIIFAGAKIKQNSYVGDMTFIREDVEIEDNVTIGKGVTIEQKTKIGNNTRIQVDAYITAYTTIENNVEIFPRVVTTNDNYMARTEERFKHKKGPLIKKYARIGANATLLPGIVVGEEGVVGAGAVVTKDVPAFKIVVGVPAKILKDVADEQLILKKEVPNVKLSIGEDIIKYFDSVTQYNNIKEEIDEKIKEVLEKGQFVLGDNVKEFEKEVAEYLGVKEAVAVGSGSDALLLSLMAIDIKPKDEVIIPSFTFFATAGAVSMLGGVPKFVDVNETGNINTELIEKAITKKTKAIIAVHLYGQSADMNKILEIAKKKKLKVIEDACQSIGASYNDKKVGSIGDIGCFSFFPTKNLGGFGDGGVIVTNNSKLAERLRVLRVHGSKEKYLHHEVGINSRLDEIQAAILRVKLKYLDSYIEKRRENAMIYNELLKDVVEIPHEEFGEHTFNSYTIQVKNRDKLRKYLSDKGIPTQIYYPLPLHLQPCFKKLKYSLPISEKLSKSVLSLPIYPELSEDKIRRISNEIISFYQIL